MIKTISTVTAAAVLLAFSNLFAQTEAPPVAPAPPAAPQTTTPAPAPTPAPASAPAPAPAVEKENKAKKHQGDNEDEGKGKHKGKGHSKDGNKMRGSDRADEMAGEHGKQGRDNTRSRGKRGKD